MRSMTKPEFQSLMWIQGSVIGLPTPTAFLESGTSKLPKNVPKLPKSLHNNLAGQLFLTQLNCCGITEVHGLLQYRRIYAGEDQVKVVPRYVLRDIMMRRLPQKGGYLMFTQAIPPHMTYDDDNDDDNDDDEYTLRIRKMRQLPYGENLKNYIEDQKLGEVHVVPSVSNSNSGNIVTAYMWKPNGEACLKWFTENFGSKAVPFYGGRLPDGIYTQEQALQYWQNESSRFDPDYEDEDEDEDEE